MTPAVKKLCDELYTGSYLKRSPLERCLHSLPQETRANLLAQAAVLFCQAEGGGELVRQLIFNGVIESQARAMVAELFSKIGVSRALQ